MVLDLHQERSVAWFREGEDDHIPLETYGDGRNPDDMLVEYFKAGFDIDILLIISPDILPAFPEACITEDNLVFQRFDTTHGNTSSSLFLSGIGLWTAFAAIFSQGNSIVSAISWKCSPYMRATTVLPVMAWMVAA